MKPIEKASHVDLILDKSHFDPEPSLTRAKVIITAFLNAS